MIFFSLSSVQWVIIAYYDQFFLHTNFELMDSGSRVTGYLAKLAIQETLTEKVNSRFVLNA